MSAVQTFLYDQLVNDAALTALVGANIFDALPSGDAPDLSVLIGAEIVIDASDKTANARLHQVEIDLMSTAAGFSNLKDVAAAVRQALERASGPAGDGIVTRIRFKRAQSSRETSEGMRRIRLRFDLFFDGY
ncbi:MAG: DUF3168 domain-containing protein [Pseudomonadota bacterium]